MEDADGKLSPNEKQYQQKRSAKDDPVRGVFYICRY